MAYWWVDTTLGTGSNTGVDPDNAWQSIETAMEYGTFASGDIIWLRRVSGFSGATSNIDPSDSASDAEWIQFVAWPRAELSFNATFTNGSTTVSIDSGLTADLEQHVGRFIKNDADAVWYLITNVTGGNFIIDREFAASTASNGASTIEADEHYTEANAIDDSAWTIKKTDYNGDNDDLPVIDFEATAYYLYLTSNYMFRFVGINFDGGTTYGGIYMRNNSNLSFKYCLFEQDQNQTTMRFNATELRCYFNQCTWIGSGSGSSQRGILADGGGCLLFLKDCAIHGFGDYGMNVPNAATFLENVNIGVETANGDDDFVMGSFDHHWKDVKLGGTNGTIVNGIYYRSTIWSENHNKILGSNYQFHCNGNNYSVAVVTGSGDPEKRSGGSDVVLAIEENEGSGSSGYLFKEMMHQPFGDGLKIWADTSSQDYRVYMQADAMSVTDADIVFMEAEYISGYDDAGEYVYSIIRSDETISQRSGASDWSQYLEAAGVQPAVAGWVKIKLYIGFYDSDGTLYADPLVD